MSNPNPKTDHLKATQWKPGESGNPDGKPKGAKHISTWIQDMLNDEEFDLLLSHPVRGVESVKGAPLKAIIKTAMIRAANGDNRWADWLAKYGYGTKLDITSGGDKLSSPYAQLTPEELRKLAEGK